MNVAISGVGGFVGSNLARRLCRDGHKVFGISRAQKIQTIAGCLSSISNIFDYEACAKTLLGCDFYLYCAGQAHSKTRRDSSFEVGLYNSNVALAKVHAKLAANSGVKRFVFISSIAVNGVDSGYQPFTPNDKPKPIDVYGRLKLAAENDLIEICKNTKMSLTIIRPPLIYGAGAPGNFRTLCNMLNGRVPLPFGGITDNKRSYVSVDNFVDFVQMAALHNNAKNEIFLVSDGKDLSTAQFIRFVSSGLGVKPTLIRLPDTFLKVGMSVLGRRELYQKLGCNLQVCIDKNIKNLGWKPPHKTSTEMMKLKSGRADA